MVNMFTRGQEEYAALVERRKTADYRYVYSKEDVARLFPTEIDRRALEDTELVYYSYGRQDEMLEIVKERADKQGAFYSSMYLIAVVRAWNVFEDTDPR